MGKVYRFTVYGVPQPQGSTRSFVKSGKVVTTSDNKMLKPWRQDLAETMWLKFGGIPYSGDGREAVTIRIDFIFAKPPSAKRRLLPTVRPDLDKLCRAVLDAGKSILYKDDAQVIALHASKHYGSPARAEITVEVQS